MNRYSKRYFYYRLLVNLLIPLVIVALSSECMPVDEEETLLFDWNILLVFLILGAVCYLISAIYSYAYYRLSGYELRNDGIVCTRGVLFKKKSYLKYERIHVVNIRKGLFQQIFGISSLLIDSGSANTAFSAEIVIVETNAKAAALMKEIMRRQDPSRKEEESDAVLYSYAKKEKWMYVLLMLLRFFAIYFIAVLFCGAVLSLSIGWNLVQIPPEKTYVIYIVIAAIFCGYFLCVALVTVGNAFLNYHRFQICEKEGSIEIRYGLLVKNTNTFQLKRIRAIRIRQGLIMKLFGYVSVDLAVIGYGEENGDRSSQPMRAPLLPLCKEKRLKSCLESILPGYVPLERAETSGRYFAMVSWRLLFSSVAFGLGEAALAMACVLSDKSVVLAVGSCAIAGGYLLSVIFLLADAFLKRRYEGIRIEGETLTVYHGGFWRTCSVIKVKDIIAISDVTTPLRKRKGIYSYVIHFRGNAMENQIRVDVLDESVRVRLIHSMTV